MPSPGGSLQNEKGTDGTVLARSLSALDSGALGLGAGRCESYSAALHPRDSAGHRGRTNSDAKVHMAN